MSSNFFVSTKVDSYCCYLEFVDFVPFWDYFVVWKIPIMASLRYSSNIG